MLSLASNIQTDDRIPPKKSTDCCTQDTRTGCCAAACAAALTVRHFISHPYMSVQTPVLYTTGKNSQDASVANTYLPVNIKRIFFQCYLYLFDQGAQSRQGIVVCTIFDFRNCTASYLSLKPYRYATWCGCLWPTFKNSFASAPISSVVGSFLLPSLKCMHRQSRHDS